MEGEPEAKVRKTARQLSDEKKSAEGGVVAAAPAFADDFQPPDRAAPKRKVGLLLGYSGLAYQGMQM